MHMLINPRRFSGKPLFLRKALIGGLPGDGDYIAVCDDLTVARILKLQKSFGRESWDWSITGPYIPEAMGSSSGSAPSLNAAQHSVRMVFDRWQAWAAVQPSAAWHQ
jgi:hypothetical protein